MNPRPFRVILAGAWGARPPKSPLRAVRQKPQRALFHHTAGHHPELDKDHSTESYAESVAYAKAIQAYHMDSNGWVDSGHNFLVTRSGYIFEGRHRSFERVNKGKMVVSAHCPGQNEQPGVEIEHNGNEPMTQIQHEAAVWLFAWICKSCSIPATHIDGHRDHYPTACPGALYPGLPQFRSEVAIALKPRVATYLLTATSRDGRTKTIHSRSPWAYGSSHFAGSFDLAKATIQLIEHG